MSRARAIETRLEKLLPSLEEYFTSGFLTRAETQEVARQRTHWEYRLVAKPLLALDVHNAVAYELGLEERLREYCVATGLVLRHRWAVLERVESIYRVGLKHVRDPSAWEQLRLALVAFLKGHGRHAALSALYGEHLAARPSAGALWAEALRYEGVERRNADGGRGIAQQALVAAGADPHVWAAALALELHFADRCMQQITQDKEEKNKNNKKDKNKKKDKDKEKAGEDPAACLRAENAALAAIVLDLSLARAVAAEALAGPACGPRLARQLIDEAARFPQAKGVAEAVAVGAMRAAIAQPWTEKAIAAFARDFVRLDVTCALPLLLSPQRQLSSGGSGSGSGSSSSGGGDWAAAAFGASVAVAMAVLRCPLPPAVASALRRGVVAATAALFSEMTSPLSSSFSSSSASASSSAALTSALRRNVSALCGVLLARGTCGPTEAVRLLLRGLEGQEKEKEKEEETKAEEIARGPCERVRSVFAAGPREDARPAKRARESNESNESKESKESKESNESNESNELCALWRAEGIARFVKGSDQHTITTTGITTIGITTGTTGTGDSVAALLAALRSGANAEELIAAFLRAGSLPPLPQLRCGPAAPAALWRLFAYLEQCDGLKPHGTQKKKNDKDSDEDSDEDNDKDSDENSYAAMGLRFLATVPCTDSASDSERRDGFAALLALRVCRAAGLRTHSTPPPSGAALRDALRTVLSNSNNSNKNNNKNNNGISSASASASAGGDGTDRIVSRLRECLRSAARRAPLPRAAVSEIAVPALEAIALESPSGRAEALRAARTAHEALVAMRGADGSAECAERNAEDWAALVAFERDIAKDLKRAKDATARARREAVDPQRILEILNRQI